MSEHQAKTYARLATATMILLNFFSGAAGNTTGGWDLSANKIA
ncbi:hypothetical protein [Janthinobacterium fluminis]|uniref:Uncharacterized protein n=1 Tax=Janthinobacterium fluminis TaxID=2987524 RepID=A0ABT5K0V2_9BURK|nr:hypothetical protein [Janthinobacterium fluminis]MDC8758489.1 hypothetical protein [Janthinobacterium fluminis]